MRASEEHDSHAIDASLLRLDRVRRNKPAPTIGHQHEEIVTAGRVEAPDDSIPAAISAIRCELNLESPSHSRPIKLPAMVVWSMAAAEGGWCVGVRFDTGSLTEPEVLRDADRVAALFAGRAFAERPTLMAALPKHFRHRVSLAGGVIFYGH